MSCLDTNKIKLEVMNLCDDVKNNTSDRITFTNAMQIKYEYLFTNSSTLFEHCIKGHLNMQQLEFMLQKIESINAGADYQQTSTEVGQRLVDIYVKPLIEPTEPHV